MEDESQERNSTEDYLNDNSCLRIPETVEDESFLDEDESEDPIVLVEDYMRTSNYTPSSGPITANAFTTFGVSIGSRNASATSSFSSTESRGSSRIQLQRKKSLAHFKLRLQLQRQGEQIVNQNRSEEGTDLETLSGCSDSSFIGHWNGNGSSNSNSNSTTNTISGRNKKANSTLEHLEGMWGKIPGSDNLKYCDLCEKPLYEISAILNKKTQRMVENPNLLPLPREPAGSDMKSLYVRNVSKTMKSFSMS